MKREHVAESLFRKVALLAIAAVISSCGLFETPKTPEEERESVLKHDLSEIDTLLKANRCDDLIKAWETRHRNWYYFASGIGRCGRYDYVIENFVYNPQSAVLRGSYAQQVSGALLLDDIHKAQKPIKEAVLKYIQDRDTFHVKAKDSRVPDETVSAAHQIVEFFVTHGWKENGQDFMKILEASPSDGMTYMAFAKYGPAVSAISGYLFPPTPTETRLKACQTLAEIGEKSALEELRKVAESDPAHIDRRGVVIYPVRDAAKSAIARIE